MTSSPTSSAVVPIPARSLPAPGFCHGNGRDDIPGNTAWKIFLPDFFRSVGFNVGHHHIAVKAGRKPRMTGSGKLFGHDDGIPVIAAQPPVIRGDTRA